MSVAVAPCPILPGELLDKVVDTVAFNEDLDTLRTCLLVSAAFRLRAQFNMLQSLHFSPDHGQDHVHQARGLLDLLENHPALAPMPESIALDWSECNTGVWGDLAWRVANLLPRLTRLAALEFSCMDADAMRQWAAACIPDVGVTCLRLEYCSASAPDFDAFLRTFPALQNLELVECDIETDDSYEPAPLMLRSCELSISAVPTTLEWARLHRESFVINGFASSPSSDSLDFVSEHAEDLRSLAFSVDESTCKADEEIASATIAKCPSLEKLQVMAPSAPRALLLFGSVVAVAPTCQTVDLQLEGGHAPDAADLVALRKLFNTATWAHIHSLLINGDEVDLSVQEPVSVPAVCEPAMVPLPPSPAFKPFLALDDFLPILDSLDDETESVVDSDLETPELSEASSDETSDNEDELPAMPRRSSFTPPFALGISRGNRKSRVESRSAPSADEDEDESDLPTPTPYQASFTARSEDGEE